MKYIMLLSQANKAQQGTRPLAAVGMVRLQGKPMNRNILLAVIFPVTFFLISLGIRNTDLNGNSGPKPRPRAVLENVEKSPQETCSKQQQDIEPCTAVLVDVPKAHFSPFIQVLHSFTVQTVVYFPSRASPFSRAKLS
jgi:hypothetical protein